MIRSWFRALIWKILLGRRLQHSSRPTSPRIVRPGLEALEQRIPTSTLNIVPPSFLGATPEPYAPALVWSGGNASSSLPSSPRDTTTELGVAGLERLLADLRQVETSRPDTPSEPPTIDPQSAPGSVVSGSVFGVSGNQGFWTVSTQIGASFEAALSGNSVASSAPLRAVPDASSLAALTSGANAADAGSPSHAAGTPEGSVFHAALPMPADSAPRSLPDSTTAPVSAPTNPLPSIAPVQPSSDAGSSAENIADQAAPPGEVAQREGGSARIGTAANPLAAIAPVHQSSGAGSNAENITGHAAPPGEFARREGDNARTGSGTSTLTASDAGLRNIAPSDGNSPSGGQGAPAGPTDSAADSRPVSNGMVPPASDQAGATEVRTAQVDTSVLPRDLSDSSLLQRFVVNRDQTAFTAIVERHERLVFGVCKRVLGDSHAAEDAFQATFLVLARKASMLDWHRPLSAWLYTVAMRLALRLRAVASRQRRSENVVALRRPTHEESANEAAIETKEVHQVLREELQRLPERYRSPLVLCYFDGRTHAEAARAIGLPRGSIAKRIGEALAQLRQRLIDRGVTL